MGIKGTLVLPYARLVARGIRKRASHPLRMQQNTFAQLVHQGRSTRFGREHDFGNIRDHREFAQRVPISDYEHFRPYVDAIIAGEKDVLWPGKPVYFAKTSGTTSGVKYIPISKESVGHHVNTARNAVFCYIEESGRSAFLDGKMIFLSGSPELDKTGGILTGRLSGIVNHQIPGWMKLSQVPSYTTNCIDDWEEKVEKIVAETLQKDMTLIGGIPSWVQMYFEKLQEKTGGKPIGEIFPSLELYVYGGVNYEPYRKKFENTIGRPLATIETYPASEGFIAFQDSQNAEGLLLNLDAGIFYEFVPANEIFQPNPTRLALWEVETGVNYAIILNTNAGLWGYLIGDTIRFVSTDPYRIVVTGRTKHYISAFGEHVIAEEVERALQYATEGTDVEVMEFHVAPQVNPGENALPYHEWFVEFGKEPEDLQAFARKVNDKMTELNIYYRDLMEGNILQPLVIRKVTKDGFREYMKTLGKLGGQNKVPRLADDRNIADVLPVNDK